MAYFFTCDFDKEAAERCKYSCFQSMLAYGDRRMSEQGTDVRAVHVSIRHDDDFMVAQFL